MGKSVLVVEDSEVNMEIVRVILTRIGYDVLEAYDGQSAYDMALVQQPDIVLMDYHLPGITGLDVVHLFKDHDDLRHIPIVALTADIYAEQEFLDAGCVDYISKPIRKTMLTRVIHDILVPDTDTETG